MNCPRCAREIARDASQCATCGLVIGADASSSKGMPTWAWVAIAVGGVLAVSTCGCVGLFLFVGGARFRPPPSSTSHPLASAVPSDVDELERALRGWSSTHEGRLPARLDDLLGPTGDDPAWIASGTLPLDRFGRAYDYRPLNDASGWTYELWSLGRDGARGGTGADADELVASGAERR